MKARINWSGKDPESIKVKENASVDEILKTIHEKNTDKCDFTFHVEHKKHGWLDEQDYMAVRKNPKAIQIFVILATQNDDKIQYLQTQVEVSARNWEQAYDKVRRGGYTPTVDVVKEKQLENA